ncbi:MAG: hypothetical protein JW908_00450 [Anaerolineales bacterium]|nr:hypothetical protein [Anaerolineales bacterium]
MPQELMIAWSDWAAYRDKHHLEVEEVIMLEHAQTLIKVRSPNGELPMPENQKQSKLSAMLKTVYENALANPGEPQRRELSSGLRIDFIYGIDSAYRIQLSRQGVFPSETEWTTVINHFPPETPMITNPPAPVDRFNYQKRCYLRSFWEV